MFGLLVEYPVDLFPQLWGNAGEGLDDGPSTRDTPDMARKPRIDFPGAWHHVMHRGARRAPIFKRDDHCTLFLECVGDAVQRSGLEVHAYALMPNHFHLLVRSPQATLSRGMKYLLASYVQRVNAERGWDGPLFRGRFKNQLVTRDDYLQHLMAYIHLNPVRAHLVARPEDECWTSYRAHMGLEAAMPWLRGDAVSTWFGGAKGLGSWVHAVQIGREAAPDGMSSDTGWFEAEREAYVAPESSEPAAVTPAPVQVPKGPEDEALLRRLCHATGTSEAQLSLSQLGRRANQARRFAVLTLVNDEGMSHREVADLLSMTVRAVASIVHRAALGGRDDSFDAWRERWASQAGE